MNTFTEIQSQRVDWLVEQVKELSEKIEELRKDKNYDIDQVHSRISVIDRYTQKTIDVEIIKLHQENVQLKEEIKNLNNDIDMLWSAIDKGIK